jgi:hypothetical protein
MPASISELLARQSVVPMQSTIPPKMTIAQWRRRRRSSRREPERRYTAPHSPPAASRLQSLRAPSCDHLCETTTRYDPDLRLLTFLLICPVCGTGKVMETQRYEPRFEPTPVSGLAEASVGASVHQLPGRTRKRPMRRAA